MPVPNTAPESFPITSEMAPITKKLAPALEKKSPPTQLEEPLLGFDWQDLLVVQAEELGKLGRQIRSGAHELGKRGTESLSGTGEKVELLLWESIKKANITNELTLQLSTSANNRDNNERTCITLYQG